MTWPRFCQCLLNTTWRRKADGLRRASGHDLTTLWLGPNGLLGRKIRHPTKSKTTEQPTANFVQMHAQSVMYPQTPFSMVTIDPSRIQRSRNGSNLLSAYKHAWKTSVGLAEHTSRYQLSLLGLLLQPRHADSCSLSCCYVRISRTSGIRPLTSDVSFYSLCVYGSIIKAN